MAKERYYLEKKNNNCKATLLERNMNGFRVNPKNQIPYEGIQVNQMTVIKPSFIEKVVKKKIKRRLDSYMQYMIMVLEKSSDEEDGAGIDIALNDLERLKRMIKNKYQMYLEEKYVALLMKKIALLERELKIKKYYFEQLDLEKEETKSKGRGR